jgi:probable rRNA maturation factor
MIRTPWRADALLRRAACATLAAEGVARGELSVAVVGAARMASLQRRYMSIAGPTDVLTFDLGSDLKQHRVEGEVVVCADEALARAGAGRKPTRAARAELALYLVHGILHLCGYEDHSAAGFRRMHRREDELLTRLGIGPVFRRG